MAAARPAGTANTRSPCLSYSTPTATPSTPITWANDLGCAPRSAIANIVTRKELIDPRKSAKLRTSYLNMQ